MFDWFFNLFGKKKQQEEEEIKIDRDVHDLEVGYILDYNLESWEVLASYTYRYKGHMAKEYKIRSSGETRFLNVSDSNSLLLSISKEANMNNIDPSLRSSVLGQNPLARINWQGVAYSLKESSKGQFTDDRLQDWASFSSWEYVDAANEKFIYVSRWEDGSVECFVGDYIKEFQISNILAST
ncbi:MAG: DUF4178 domain-containing protein [Aureispira sp.]